MERSYHVELSDVTRGIPSLTSRVSFFATKISPLAYTAMCPPPSVTFPPGSSRHWLAACCWSERKWNMPGLTSQSLGQQWDFRLQSCVCVCACVRMRARYNRMAAEQGSEGCHLLQDSCWHLFQCRHYPLRHPPVSIPKHSSRACSKMELWGPTRSPCIWPLRWDIPISPTLTTWVTSGMTSLV